MKAKLTLTSAKKKTIKPGKKTLAWNKTRAELKIEFEDMGITSCELQFPECTRDNFLGFAHTKKRRYVTDLKRVVLACTNCHQTVEYTPDMEMVLENVIANRKLTEGL